MVNSPLRALRILLYESRSLLSSSIGRAAKQSVSLTHDRASEHR